MAIDCPDCGDPLNEPTDTTYCNMKSSDKAAYKDHTGDIYTCEKCDCFWLDSFIRDQIELWNY